MATISTKLVPSNGYDCNFVSEPDDALKCLICLAVAKEPLQHGKCGRLFCRKCLKKHGRNKSCPNCRLKQPLYFEDTKSKREVQALRVKCDYVERGCEWEGTVGTLKEHLIPCEIIPVPCPQKCKQNNTIKMIMRKDLNEHLEEHCVNRSYECLHCGKKDTYTNIMDVHDDICEKKVVCCPNDECTEEMERGEIEEHLESICEYTLIQCKYENIGCDVVLRRRDMWEHILEDDEIHLYLALEKLKSATETIELMKQESEDMTVQLESAQISQKEGSN